MAGHALIEARRPSKVMDSFSPKDRDVHALLIAYGHISDSVENQLAVDCVTLGKMLLLEPQFPQL